MFVFVVAGGAFGQSENADQSADRILQQFSHPPQKDAIRTTDTVSTTNTSVVEYLKRSRGIVVRSLGHHFNRPRSNPGRDS